MFLKCFGYTSSSSSSSQRQRQYPTIIEELCHQFSLVDLRKATNNFDQNRQIGSDGFSEVYKGCLQHNGRSDYPVSVKRFNAHSCRSPRKDRLKNEIELLCQLRHPNCVSLIGFCNDKNEKIVVYEYPCNGSLARYLEGSIDRYLQGGDTVEALSWKKRLEICIGAARGLHYLHAGAKRTIIHRHIKPSNILLDHNMQPKLSDFSFGIQGALSMSKPKRIQADVVGTGGYTAREHIIDGTVTDKCDVYSFGVVLLELLWGREYKISPYEKEFLEKPVEDKIDPNIRGKIAPQCWQVFVDITKRCLKLEPDERPIMGEVKVELEHALSLQEQADILNNNCDYTLLSKTIIPWVSY